MKKFTFLMALILGLSFNAVKAQSINQLSKQGSAALQNAQGSSSALLGDLDKELSKKFNLDGVKSEIIGNTLKMKVADADFANLSATAKTKQAGDMMSSAMQMLSGKGMNLKSMGITKIVVDMVKNMKATDILSTLSKNL